MDPFFIIFSYVLVCGLTLVGISLGLRRNTFGILSQLHAITDFTLTIIIYVIYHDELPKYVFKEQYLMLSYFGIYEILVTSLIFFIVFLYATGYIDNLIDSNELQEKQVRNFYLIFNLLLLVEILAFLMNNLMLFWIFLEITTLLIVLLTTIPRAEYNIDAALKYTFITSSAMVFTFLGFIFLYAYVKDNFSLDNLNWNELMLISNQLPSGFMGIIFGLSFIGFGAKAGVVPFHFWRPHLYSRSPSVVSAILSTIIMNTSIYGLFRIYAIIRNTDSRNLANIILILYGLFSIIGAAFSLLEEQNLKKIYSFSTIEHVGIIIIGLSTNSKIAMYWLLYHILAHSIAKVLLFLSAGILHRQYTKNQSTFFKDIMYIQPLASVGIIIGTCVITGFPPFAVFISKFYILSEVTNTLVLFLSLAFLSLSYIGMLRFVSRIFSQVSHDIKDSSNQVLDGLSELQDTLNDDLQVDTNFTLGFGEERYFRPSNGMRGAIISLTILGFLFGILIPSFLSDLLDKIVEELGY